MSACVAEACAVGTCRARGSRAPAPGSPRAGARSCRWCSTRPAARRATSGALWPWLVQCSASASTPSCCSRTWRRCRTAPAWRSPSGPWAPRSCRCARCPSPEASRAPEAPPGARCWASSGCSSGGWRSSSASSGWTPAPSCSGAWTGCSTVRPCGRSSRAAPVPTRAAEGRVTACCTSSRAPRTSTASSRLQRRRPLSGGSPAGCLGSSGITLPRRAVLSSWCPPWTPPPTTASIRRRPCRGAAGEACRLSSTSTPRGARASASMSASSS
mmetsp:Transcript_11026/g.29093  ORF Transcript_11026/g.29093 Transcript_11026/m.29093 type:complete len:271 (+) Transcript_11026:118-930(+)